MREEVPGLTIDSASTRDIDDAIWVEEVPEGFRVLVSIADVSSAVPVGSRTELRARVMVETKYRATWNLPMLPRALAENRLSLWAGQKRDSVTIEIGLSRDLHVRSTQLYLSTVTSKVKLSHEDVPVILEAPHASLSPSDSTVKPVLLLAQRLALGLLEQRRSAGALVLYDLNNGWVTTEEGHLKQIDKKTATIGYIIIQELMVLANASVAEWVIEHNIPVLFRNHEARAATPDRTILVRQLQDSIHTPLEGLEALKARVHMLLSKADYGTKLFGHYGLNLPAYLHFTSPIRRYADFVNHRQIVGCLGVEKLSYSQERLEEEAIHINSVLKADRESMSEHMKNKAEKMAQRNVARGRVETLNMKDFERLMKVEARSGQDVSEALREGFLKRLPANLVPPVCLTVLLAEAPSSPIVEYMGWVGLKEAAIQWMKARPELATTVATMATQTNAWPEIKYESDRTGPDHNPVFKILASFQDKVVAEVYGSSVKEAKQRAALSILALHSGLPAPSEFATPQTQEATETGRTFQEPVGARHGQGLRLNHVSILQEYCQARGMPLPTYEFELSGPSHAPVVICTCKFGPLVGTAKAGNKQDAKRLAAKIVAFSAVEKA